MRIMAKEANMLYFKWVGKFHRGGEGKIVTLKMHVMHKHFAEASIEKKVNHMLVEGWTLLGGQLFPTGCRGHPRLGATWHYVVR